MHSTAPEWRNVSLSPARRADALVTAMTLREKVAQLSGVWVGASDQGGDIAPYQHEMEDVVELDDLLQYGLGHLTRPFGSKPVDAAVGLIALAKTQRRIADANRFGIPAIAHEECLAGFTAWGATAYPVPLSWGATFDPALIERMAARIGTSMRAVGVHQGLAPILDVARDHRWGRVEETIGEDPYLVGVVATAYVRGLEASGIVATLKHFVGYSSSRSGRNLAPVSMGAREFADVMVPPFEMAVRESAVRSVMHSYTDTDGVPCAADESLLTGLLRDTWGFAGTVVADYTGVTFLKTLHGVAETTGEAGRLALTAGVDIELPTIDAYGDPLVAEVEAGRLDESIVDRALRRVLVQKIELGLLDPGWNPLPAGWDAADLADADREAVRGRVDLDTPADRALAREIAERAIVLLSNDGTLPLAASGPGSPRRIAVIGPCGDDPVVLLGCYAFPNHVLDRNPGLPMLIEIPTIADAVRTEYPDAEVSVLAGVDIESSDRSGIAEAVALAAASDFVVVAVGDRAGLFGRGTSGEGCDADDLNLPGQQWPLLDAVLSSGTPVITTVVSGRPYVLNDAPERSVAVVQAFFPGEEGAGAIAGVVSGRVRPSGRLPVSIPSTAGGQPNTYLAATLARATRASNLDPTPRFPFGYGLGYDPVEWASPLVNGEPVTSAALGLPTDGALRLSVDIANSGNHDVVDVVQVYLHDPVASVVRPVVRLVAFASVPVAVGETTRVAFDISADFAAFTGRGGKRIVEPGRIELRVSASSSDVRFTVPVDLVGPVRTVDHTRVLTASVEMTAVD